MSNTVRLPDPFTNPGEAPGFLSAPLIDNEPIIQDELPGGKVLQVKTAAQYWSTTITYPELHDLEYRLVSSAILEAKRTDAFIEIVLPQYTNYRVFGDTTLVNIAANQQGNSLVVSNINHLEGRPYLGDLFKLSTHPKVYKITKFEKVGSTWVLGVYPNLFITTNGTEKPEFNGVKLQTKLMGRATQTENLDTDGMYTGVSYTFRESL